MHYCDRITGICVSGTDLELPSYESDSMIDSSNEEFFGQKGIELQMSNNNGSVFTPNVQEPISLNNGISYNESIDGPILPKLTPPSNGRWDSVEDFIQGWRDLSDRAGKKTAPENTKPSSIWKKPSVDVDNDDELLPTGTEGQALNALDVTSVLIVGGYLIYKIARSTLVSPVCGPLAPACFMGSMIAP